MGKAVTNFAKQLPAPQSELAQMTLKDPYMFDFLGVGKEVHERDIEAVAFKPEYKSTGSGLACWLIEG